MESLRSITQRLIALLPTPPPPALTGEVWMSSYFICVSRDRHHVPIQKSKKDNSFVSLKGHNCFPSGTVSISSTVLKMEVLFLHSVVIDIQTWSDYSIGLVSPKFLFICRFPLPFFFVPLQFYLLE